MVLHWQVAVGSIWKYRRLLVSAVKAWEGFVKKSLGFGRIWSDGCLHEGMNMG